MQYISDEDILYNCYKKLGENNTAKKKKVDFEEDKSAISGIASSTSLILTRLKSTDLKIPAEDIQKYIISAKGIFLHFSSIKGRHPSCITDSIEKSMDELLHSVCRHEANMIDTLKQQEPNGNRIDIKRIFEQKKYFKKLGNETARNVVASAISDNNIFWSAFPPLYITETGKKFHVGDCPYCKGRKLIPASSKLIEDNGATPCKCMESLYLAGEKDHTCVTAFIDERIYPVHWDEKGHKGNTGSYSYIICWGRIADETQITEERMITQGVEYAREQEHIERITETAIGKVMIALIYDYEFSGKLRIFSDNQTAVNHWAEIAKNSKLAQHFEDVEVVCIPREKNTRADILGRSRMLLDMPISAYTETVRKCDRLKELEIKIRKFTQECACGVA